MPNEVQIIIQSNAESTIARLWEAVSDVSSRTQSNIPSISPISDNYIAKEIAPPEPSTYRDPINAIAPPQITTTPINITNQINTPQLPSIEPIIPQLTHTQEWVNKDIGYDKQEFIPQIRPIEYQPQDYEKHIRVPEIPFTPIQISPTEINQFNLPEISANHPQIEIPRLELPILQKIEAREQQIRMPEFSFITPTYKEFEKNTISPINIDTSIEPKESPQFEYSVPEFNISVPNEYKEYEEKFQPSQYIQPEQQWQPIPISSPSFQEVTIPEIQKPEILQGSSSFQYVTPEFIPMKDSQYVGFIPSDKVDFSYVNDIKDTQIQPIQSGFEPQFQIQPIPTEYQSQFSLPDISIEHPQFSTRDIGIPELSMFSPREINSVEITPTDRQIPIINEVQQNFSFPSIEVGLREPELKDINLPAIQQLIAPAIALLSPDRQEVQPIMLETKEFNYQQKEFTTPDFPFSLPEIKMFEKEEESIKPIEYKQEPPFEYEQPRIEVKLMDDWKFGGRRETIANVSKTFQQKEGSQVEIGWIFNSRYN